MKGKQFRRWVAGILCALLLLSLPPCDGALIYRAFAETLPAASEEIQTSETAQADPAASLLQEDEEETEPQPESDPEPAETATPENAVSAPLGAPKRRLASYTVSLNPDGGVLEGLAETGWTQDPETDQWTCTLTETTAGAGALLSLGQPTREGYVFDGWEAGEGAAQQEDGSWLITGDTAFTARWLPVATPGTALLDLKSTQTVTITARKWSNTNNSYSLVLSHADAQTMPNREALVDALNRTANGLQLSYTYTTPEGSTEEETADFSIDWTDSRLDTLLAKMKEDVDAHNINGNTYTITLPDAYLAGLIATQEELVAEEIQLVYNTAFSQGVQLVVTLGASQSTIPGDKEQYEIQTVDPQNVTFNLFDYWVTDPLISDQISDSNIYQFNLFQSGVNKDHGLIFRKNSASGTWNAWTNNTGGVRKDIVQNNLQDDYPVLNLKDGFGADGNWGGTTGTYNPEESLEYLFNPTKVKEGNYGKAYSNVTGLLKIADNGNYYYCSHDNFAEFDQEKNRFNVYNTWGVKKGGSSPDGQFFPFNSAEEVFDVGGDGQLTQKNFNSLNDRINHYLGLTMEVEFQQPVDGMVSVGASAKPMVFDFSGDDDVWIFIDGVLVADLGGIHDEMKVSIDFSTGAIHVERASNPNPNTTWDTTLKDQFEAAGDTSTSFDGDTFAGNTVHTLKMFYLERGNTDSNLTLSFNLMEPLDSELIKLDQNGEPVTGAGFSLYEAVVDEAGQPLQDSDGSYLVGNLIANNLTSDADGHCALPEDYDFSQHTYYFLRETTIPSGYFSTGDVLLRYDRFEKHPDGTSSGTNLLLVENRWTTGAVSNFVAQVSQAGTLHYDDGSVISLDTGQDGLILAVPLLKSTAGDWLPLYGSNLTGYHAVEYDLAAGDTAAQQRKAILTAALRQIYGAGQDEHQGEDLGYRRWYLEWNEKNQRYQGTLVDLPGDASRYYWASGSVDADMSAAYYFLDLDSLKEIFNTITGMDTADKLNAVYQAIQNADGENAIQQLVEKILNQDQKVFGLLDVGEFNRTFASRIYVPDVEPKLGVQKLDSDGNPLEGAEFTLYRGSDTTSGKVVATGTTDANGLLIFSQTVQDGLGTAKAVLTQGNYILKETAPPTGYEPKNEEIPVYVTVTGRVYADALKEDDGITVRKGLGKLLQTMVRYAADDSVNVTLRDITASLVTAEKVEDLPAASPTGASLQLHYGLSNALLEYGTHEVDGVAPNPYFEVDTGYAGIRIQQNYHAHEGDALYSAVVVRNRKTDEKGKFSLRKTVSGLNLDPEQAFPFEVSVSEPQTESWKDHNCPYTVTDAEGKELETGTLTFEKEGDYLYRIAGVTPAGDTESSYIKNEADTYQIWLKDGQKIEVENLPFDATVTAEEMDSTGYTTQVSVNDGEWTTETRAAGNVARPIGNPAFHFHNHKDLPTDLELKKVVSGTKTGTGFPFTIRLTDASDSALLTGSYDYIITNEAGAQTGKGSIEDGTLTVNLGDGDTLIIRDLPVGARYLITETPMGFTPTVTVNGEPVQVQDNRISGQLEQRPEGITAVTFTNSRTGSITITKRDGVGNLLRGAGFTLYTVDGQGNKTAFGVEQMTELAMNVAVDQDDPKFDADAMRYTDGTNSYTVHTTKDNRYFYYRFLTESERQQYYNGTLQNSDRVEAVVQFTDLPLENTYAVEETTVPDGYVQNADFEATMGSIRLGQSSTGQTNPVYDILYTVTNHKKLTLPTAGQMGIAPTLMMGVLLLAAAALLLWTARRKPRRAGPSGPRHPTP